MVTRVARRRAAEETHSDGLVGKPKWLAGGEFDQNVWVIEITDGSIRPLPRTRTIHWDSPISPGLRLSDPAMSSDLRTGKLLISNSVAPTGKLTHESAIVRVAADYMQFVRWRLHHNIFRNADLTPEWFEKLLADLRLRGIARLVPSVERAQAYVTDVQKGNVPFPLKEHVKGTIDPDMEEILFRLGFSASIHLESDAIGLLPAIFDQVKLRTRNHAMFKEQRKEVRKADSETRLSAFLRTISQLWVFRDALGHDAIPFDPRELIGGSGSLRAKLATQRPGRTKTVPSEAMCTLVDRALTWVLEYGPVLLEFIDLVESILKKRHARNRTDGENRALKAAMRIFKFPEAGPYTPWPMLTTFMRGRVSDRALLTVNDAVYRLLPAACMIVIATFSARRDVEVTSLQRDSRLDKNGIHYIKTYIAKTQRSMGEVPVPICVHKAVHLLEMLGDKGGVDSPFLFEFNNINEAIVEGRKVQASRFDSYRDLEHFAKHTGCTALDSGEEWIPKPHQFRRFFAIVYFNRFRYPHLTALSLFLRHNSLEMTVVYVTEIDWGGENASNEAAIARHQRARRKVDFVDAERQSVLERLENIATGAEEVGGFGGEEIKRALNEMIADAKVRLELVDGDELPRGALNDLLQLMAAGTKLEPNGLGHSYCKCTHRPEDIGTAACVALAIQDGADAAEISRPVQAYSRDEVCAFCPHNVVFSECLPYWHRLYLEASDVSENHPSPIMRSLAKARAELAGEHLRRWSKVEKQKK